MSNADEEKVMLCNPGLSCVISDILLIDYKQGDYDEENGLFLCH